jgi:hypothetical protein
MRSHTRRGILVLTLLIAIAALSLGCERLREAAPTMPTATEETAPTPTEVPTEAPTEPPDPSPTAEPTATSIPPTATPPSTSLDPTVVIAPTSGAPGSEIEISATGFRPRTAVEIGIGRVESEYNVVDTAEADAEGQVATTVTLPEFAEDGEQWVAVVSVIGQPVRGTSNTFSVTGAADTPTVAVTPQAGSPGTRITVRAEGFTPGATVDIGFGRVNSEYDVLTSDQADAAGALVTDVPVPDFADPEDQWVFVAADLDRGVKAISDPFDVTSETAMPTATPATGAFTSANIYLIAVDDGGASGELIGCNDSVVPVEVTFEPTVAPLRAALNALFAVDTDSYGSSGLYNALHQSDLSVGAINIAQGTATIALTGDLLIGGVCDAPRVTAQIEETALQFATVDSVEVTLNGQPLEDVLSMQ